MPPTRAWFTYSVFTRGALPEPLAALICGSLRVVMLEKDKGLCVTLHSTLGDKTPETGRTEHKAVSRSFSREREREHTRGHGRRLSQRKQGRRSQVNTVQYKVCV